MANLSVLIFICSMGLSVLANSFISDDDKQNIITLHNTLRRNFAEGSHGVFASNMEKLSWSEALESDAANALTCGASRSSVEESTELNSNLYRNLQGNFANAITSWFSEMRLFIPEEGTCFFYRRCLHAMTMLNARHRRIGCAYNDQCHDHQDKFLCLYEGGREVIPVFERGLPCTKCSDQTPFCEEGLCVPCDIHNHRCDCRKTCNKPGIGTGHLDNSTCTCSCYSGRGPNCDEECRNPEQYEDWDPCAEITKEMCISPEFVEMGIEEFCPEQCSCNRYIGE